MRKGFTILELLVASLLLGMLVTILTMLFNQSSIAWRTGTAGVAEMDEVRDNIAEIREEADNLIVSGKKVGRITSLWLPDGSLRERAISVKGAEEDDSDVIVLLKTVDENTTQAQMKSVAMGQGESGKSFKTYTVGVTSKGPNGALGDYDDITSWPDELEE